MLGACLLFIAIQILNIAPNPCGITVSVHINPDCIKRFIIIGHHTKGMVALDCIMGDIGFGICCEGANRPSTLFCYHKCHGKSETKTLKQAFAVRVSPVNPLFPHSVLLVSAL